MTTTDPAERLDPLRRENIVAALTESGVMEEWEAENGRAAIVRSFREHGITLAPLDYQISARDALAAAYQRGWDEALDRIRNIWATRHARPEWTADMTNTLDDQADR